MWSCVCVCVCCSIELVVTEGGPSPFLSRPGLVPPHHIKVAVGRPAQPVHCDQSVSNATTCVGWLPIVMTLWPSQVSGWPVTDVSLCVFGGKQRWPWDDADYEEGLFPSALIDAAVPTCWLKVQPAECVSLICWCGCWCGTSRMCGERRYCIGILGTVPKMPIYLVPAQSPPLHRFRGGAIVKRC